MIVLNGSHEQILFSSRWAGDTSLSAVFELARTRFEIWRQNIMTNKF